MLNSAIIIEEIFNINIRRECGDTKECTVVGKSRYLSPGIQKQLLLKQ